MSMHTKPLREEHEELRIWVDTLKETGIGSGTFLSGSSVTSSMRPMSSSRII